MDPEAVEKLVKQIQESNENVIKTMMEEGNYKKRDSVLQSQEEMIKQLKEENVRLRQNVGAVTPSKSKPVAVADPLTMKETADQLKEARQNVPKLKRLPRSNHIDFIKKIEKVLELKKGMKKFLQDVHDNVPRQKLK